MGLFSGFRKRVRAVFARLPGVRSTPPPPPERPRGGAIIGPPSDYGYAFGADSEAHTQSTEGHAFSFWIAGVKFQDGSRVDLEKDPGRVLTDSELVDADYVVVRYASGPNARYVTIVGPWNDWWDLWDHITVEYDNEDSP